MEHSNLGKSSWGKTARLRIGIVANEFPPMVGGMQQHAFGLAKELAKTQPVVVFTNVCNAEACGMASLSIRPVLKGAVWLDYKILASQTVDVWLVLNAGYAALSEHLRAPVVMYCHGNDFLQPWISQSRLDDALAKRWGKHIPFLWRIEPWLARRLQLLRLTAGISRAAGVFVNSRFTKKLLEETFGDLRTPILVSNPGLSDAFFTVPVRKNPDFSPHQAIRLVSVARLERSAAAKNIEGLLRAVAQVKTEIPVECQIVGGGNRLPEFRKLAHRLDLNSIVDFVGHVANEEIHTYLDRADLFVLVPSGLESFGIAYTEAAARGLPSLASRMGGATDAIEEGRSGMILEGCAPEDIAEGIRRFCRDREHFRPEDVRAFANQFRWSVVAEQMLTNIRHFVAATYDRVE